MTESQTTAPRKIKSARKRPKSRISDWLAIFVCAQVGLNVAKQHIRENFKGLTNEIVTAQPEEFPRKQRINYGRAQESRDVRLPNLSAKYARATLVGKHPLCRPYIHREARQKPERSNAQVSLPER